MPETEDKATQEKRAGTAKYWLEQIRLASKREETWRKRGNKVIERYRAEKSSKGSKFNILWANTEILKPAVYAKPPKPDVRRRHKRAPKDQNDPLIQVYEAEKQSAVVLEKSLDFLVDDPKCDFDATIQSVRDDVLLPGRGICWVVYEPSFDRVHGIKEPVKVSDPVTGDEMEVGERITFDGQESEPEGTDSQGPYIDNLAKQEVYVEYVYWEDYRESPARRAKDVWWRARRHFMDLPELKDTFPDLGSEVLNIPRKLNTLEPDKKDEAKETFSRAVVWEIWNKSKRKRIFVAEGYNDGPLADEDDPYELENFYPCAEPLVAVHTTSSRIPIPEFTIYQDQADELDNLTFRISKLIDACKVRGLYAAVVKEFNNLMSGDDNEMFPVEDWAALTAKGGLEGAVTWLPIEQIAKVLVYLYQQRDSVKKEIYEITGLSDLSRGDTKSSETATAQQLKANYGNIRMNPRQRPMEKFIRDTLRIMAELVAEHFTAENLEAMTGEQISPQVLQILRDDKSRGFVVDIETDSTVEPDATQEKSEATEFLTAVTNFFTGIAPIVQQVPQTGPLFMAILKQGIRSFKAGRPLEDEIDKAADQIAQMGQQPQGPSPADMAQAKKDEATAQATVMDAQTNQAKAAADAKAKQVDSTAKIVQMLQPQGAA